MEATNADAIPFEDGSTEPRKELDIRPELLENAKACEFFFMDFDKAEEFLKKSGQDLLDVLALAREELEDATDRGTTICSCIEEDGGLCGFHQDYEKDEDYLAALEKLISRLVAYETMKTEGDKTDEEMMGKFLYDDELKAAKELNMSLSAERDALRGELMAIKISMIEGNNITDGEIWTLKDEVGWLKDEVCWFSSRLDDKDVRIRKLAKKIDDDRNTSEYSLAPLGIYYLLTRQAQCGAKVLEKMKAAKTAGTWANVKLFAICYLMNITSYELDNEVHHITLQKLRQMVLQSAWASVRGLFAKRMGGIKSHSGSTTENLCRVEASQ